VRSVVSKVDEFSTVLRVNNIDIACLTETWLKDEISTDIVTVKGYVSHRKDRPDGRRGGGVAVYVCEQLPCYRLLSYENAHFDVIWLLFRLSRMPRSVSHIAVGTIYHHPSPDGRLLINYLLALCCSVISTSYAIQLCCHIH